MLPVIKNNAAGARRTHGGAPAHSSLDESAYKQFLDKLRASEQQGTFATALGPSNDHDERLQLQRVELKLQEHKATNIPGQRAGTLLLLFRHYARIGHHKDAQVLSKKARPKKMVRAASFVCNYALACGS